jgi:hypothetical protein
MTKIWHDSQWCIASTHSDKLLTIMTQDKFTVYFKTQQQFHCQPVFNQDAASSLSVEIITLMFTEKATFLFLLDY